MTHPCWLCAYPARYGSNECRFCTEAYVTARGSFAGVLSQEQILDMSLHARQVAGQDERTVLIRLDVFAGDPVESK